MPGVSDGMISVRTELSQLVSTSKELYFAAGGDRNLQLEEDGVGSVQKGCVSYKSLRQIDRTALFALITRIWNLDYYASFAALNRSYLNIAPSKT